MTHFTVAQQQEDIIITSPYIGEIFAPDTEIFVE